MRLLPCLSTQHSSRVESLRLDAFTISGGDPDEQGVTLFGLLFAQEDCNKWSG